VLACAPSLPAYFEDLRAAIRGARGGVEAEALNRKADFFSAGDEAAEAAALAQGRGGAAAAFVLVGGEQAGGEGGDAAAAPAPALPPSVTNLVATCAIFGVLGFIIVQALQARK
jgi:hypothetical protein